MTRPGRPTPADLVLAYLCALARSRPVPGDALPPHRRFRLCGLPVEVLVEWAERFGRPVDPMPRRVAR